MAVELIWAILAGVVLGAAFGYAGGTAPIGIAMCIAAGAITAGLWHCKGTRRT